MQRRHRVTRPVLITEGRRDDGQLPPPAKLVRSRVPHAQLSWYEELGHRPFIEDHARLNRELAFVARAARTSVPARPITGETQA